MANPAVDGKAAQLRRAVERHFRKIDGGTIDEDTQQIIDIAVEDFKKDERAKIAARKRKATIHRRTYDIFDE